MKGEKIKILMNDIVSEDFLKSFHNLLEMKVPSKLRYWMVRLNDVIVSEGNQYNKIKNDLVVKYGIQDPKHPNLYNLDPNQKDEFLKELNGVLSIEVELPITEKLTFLESYGEVSPLAELMCRKFIDFEQGYVEENKTPDTAKVETKPEEKKIEEKK